MAGGSPRHNLLSSAIAAELRTAARALGCHGLLGAGDVLLNPTAVVEVLSPSTEAHDRGLKWEAYQRLASLTDYLLVAQGQVRVEHYRREADAWRYQVLVAGDTIVLSNGARVAVDAIYEGVFETPGP
jgi:Uma2 family endonuclease